MFCNRRLKENGGSVRVAVAAELTTNPAAAKTVLARKLLIQKNR